MSYAEHQLMGDNLNLKWNEEAEGSRCLASDMPLNLANGASLTYGQINALAGDFFGTFAGISGGARIEDRRKLFMAAYSTLAVAESGKTKAQAVSNIMQKEVDAIKERTEGGTADMFIEQYPGGPAAPSASGQVFHALKYTEDLISAEDDQLEQATIVDGLPSYMTLAYLNLDHFGVECRSAYIAGHACALDAAAAGDLMEAYAINAFADHFLGDAFAAGHFRTPRRRLHGDLLGDSREKVQDRVDQLVEILRGGTLAFTTKLLYPDFLDLVAATGPDVCAKFMHDEDNALGLWVTNLRGDEWKMFGDGKVFDAENHDNRNTMRVALQVSADEVYEAYRTKAVRLSVEDYRALTLVPIAELKEKNHSPLFNDQGWYRQIPDNPACKVHYDSHQQGAPGYQALAMVYKFLPHFKNMYLA